MHLNAKKKHDEFTRACADQEDDVKSELEGVVGIFKNVLTSTNAEAMRLLDGSYLYMKSNTSTRALNEEHIGTAVENLTLDQLRRVATQMRAGDNEAGADAKEVTLLAVLCACLHENIDDECVRISYSPNIAKRRPTSLDPTFLPKPANDAIERAADQYRSLKQRLTQIRQHKSRGRKRCAEVHETTEPVIRAFLEERNTKSQRVRFVAETPIALPTATPPTQPVALPALPALLPAHRTEEADRPPEPKRRRVEQPPLVVQDTHSTAPSLVEFKTRLYTSRGKAPRLRQFAELLPDCAGRVVSITTRLSDTALKKLASGDTKKAILNALLSQFQEMFNQSKGQTTQRIAIKQIA